MCRAEIYSMDLSLRAVAAVEPIGDTAPTSFCSLIHNVVSSSHTPYERSAASSPIENLHTTSSATVAEEQPSQPGVWTFPSP